jgi:asparagine synthase (glutamine-hydrolysing)
MCGIAGVVYADPQRPVDTAALRAMSDAIVHRGPDAEGFFVEPGIGLAHRRLSIIDLAGGDQPIGNEDGSVQVVFNGEIYNYAELRRELEGRGHHFRTHSDTEVLVHLYEELGEGLVERLRGMFAFAIWDRRKRSLVLGRDRVGQKPLYFYYDSEKLLFASEIKAILAFGDVSRELDLNALEDYLTFGVIPGSRSIFRQIRKLPPAHVLTISEGLCALQQRRYWSLRMDPDEGRSVAQWLEALRSKFAETVQAHRIADVPIGAFLSGGLDSSAVVASLMEAGGPAIKTFSIGFDEEEFSELPYARQVARQFGTEHVEEIVTAGAIQSLEDLVHFYDEPFADASAIHTMCLARVARGHVKVALSGDGGDEAFGGYRRYAHDLRENALRNWIPGWARRALLGRVARVWPKADWLPRPLRLKTALTNLSLDPAEAYANTISLCRPPLRRNLLSEDIRRTLNGHRPEAAIEAAYGRTTRDALAGMITADVSMLLPDDFLTKVDRASMAVGLEVRPPLVDHELLELAARIPSRFKVSSGETKWIFKQMLAERLPSDVVWRPKRGFEIPVDAWLRGPLRPLFEETVLSPRSRLESVLRRTEVEKLYHRHLRGQGRHGNVLWSILVLGRWMDAHLPPAPARADHRSGAVLAGATA